MLLTIHTAVVDNVYEDLKKWYVAFRSLLDNYPFKYVRKRQFQSFQRSRCETFWLDLYTRFTAFLNVHLKTTRLQSCWKPGFAKRYSYCDLAAKCTDTAAQAFSVNLTSTKEPIIKIQVNWEPLDCLLKHNSWKEKENTPPTPTHPQNPTPPLARVNIPTRN